MRYNLSRLLGVLVGIPIAIISWVTSVFGFDLSFILDALIGIGMFCILFSYSKIDIQKYLNEIGLSRRDYRFVNQQLNQSHNKIRNILKSYINIDRLKIFVKLMIFIKFLSLFILLLNRDLHHFQSRKFLLFAYR